MQALRKGRKDGGKSVNRATSRPDELAGRRLGRALSYSDLLNR